MKILDRYIAKGFFTYFIGALVVFASLFTLVDLIQKAVKDGSSMAVIQYGLLQLPFVLSQMTPMACLIGSLFILNTLAKNSELIAMHACGISIYRIAAPILILSFVIGVVYFFTADFIVPPTFRKARQVLHRDIRGQKGYQIFKTNRLWHRSENAIYNMDFFNHEKSAIDGLHIYLFDDTFQLMEQIHATKAIFDGEHWTLQNGVSITFLDDFPVSHAFKSKRAYYIRERPEDLKEISKLESLSFNELRHYIKRHRRAGFNTIRHEVNLHAKISYAMACVIMAFLSIPFSAKNPRSGGWALSAGMALGIAFFYWICLNAGLSFGYSGTLPPFLAAWIANIMFVCLGAYLLVKQQRTKKSWLS